MENLARLRSLKNLAELETKLAEEAYKLLYARVFERHQNTAGSDIGTNKKGLPVNVMAFKEALTYEGNTVKWRNARAGEIIGYLEARFGTFMRLQDTEIQHLYEYFHNNRPKF